MAEGFSFSTTAFHSKDTARYMRYQAAKRRQEIIRRREQREEPTPEVTVEEAAVVVAPTEKGTKEQSSHALGPVGWANKNLYGASIAFMLVFSAFIGIQNLQSSLNAELGLTSLAVTYMFYLLVGFVTPAIVRLLGTKYSLLFGFLCHTIYIGTNFYPEYYTLIPASVLLGIGLGPVWVGLSTHVATTAITLAPHVTESIDILISKFTATFFFILKLTHIFGNLASSLVLFPYDEPFANDTTSNVCDNTEAQDITPTQIYTLLSIYLAFNFIGILVLVIFVNKLPSERADFVGQTTKLQRYCSEPFVDLLKVLFSWKMLLLGPLSFYNGMELSFVYGSFAQVFISECVGVSKVGFGLIVLAFFSAAASFTYRKILYIPRVCLTALAALINMLFLFFLQFWPRQPRFELIFLFAFGWGVADGVWNTASACLVGILFPEDQEAAFSAFRIWMSLGFSFGFAIAQLRDTGSRLWILLSVLIVSYTLYILLELFISKYGEKICQRRMKRDSEMTESMLGNEEDTLPVKHRGVFSPFKDSFDVQDDLYADDWQPPHERSTTYTAQKLPGKDR